MANLFPPAKSAIVKQNKSAIIKADKFIGSSKVKDKTTKIRTPKKSGQNLLLSIEKKVIKIDKLLKNSLALKKKDNEKQRRGKERGSFEEKEKDLEKKKQPKVKGINLPSAPKLGIFDWIKNFIFNTLLGFIAIRLIDHLPKLKGIFTTVVKVGEFIIDIGGRLLNGLITFIDWGYKAVDATRGFIKNIGGEGLAQNFDKFAGAIDNVIEVAIIAALATADSGVGGDLMDLGGGRSGGVGIRGTKDVAGRSRYGTTAEAARRYSQRFGRDAAVRKFGEQGVRSLGGKYARSSVTNVTRSAFVNLAGKGGAKAILKFTRPLLKRLPIIGALIDFGLSVALGEPLGRAAFKSIGAGLLGALGAAIGSVVPVAGNIVGGIIGGVAGDAIGGALYDMFFGGKKPKQAKGKVVRAAGGGRPTTRGGQLVEGSARRTLKKKKKKARTFIPVPKKIKPGKNTGGDKKIQSVFPNPEKPEGFLGWLQSITGGGQQQQQQTPKKPSEKTANPQEFLVKSNDVLGKANFFGPFFTLALKSVLGDKPGKLDYMNVGRGLNAWMQATMKSGNLGFAGGGEVDAKQFFQGEDYTDVIAKSVEDSVSGKVDQTIRDLARELSLKPVGREEMIQENIRKGQEGVDVDGEGFEVGPAGSSGDKLTMARNLMRDLGLTAAQAAGIVGNMAAESGVENARPQGSRPGTKAPLKVDGVTGYGLVQWTSKGRQQALADFARSRGVDLSKPLSMDIEYQFFLKEFKGAYGNVLKQIKNAPDTKTASTIFMQQYEIPAGYKTEAKIMERYNMSKPIYDRLSKGEGKATEGKGTYIAPSTSGAAGTIGGIGKFIQGNSGNSRGVHFHIGPGSQTKGTILQSQYNADARASASKVVDYFLKKGSTVYDGRRGTYYKSGKEVAAAQRAHSASGSQGGIDLQVDFEKPVPFPLNVMGMSYRPNGFGVSADIVGSNSFVAHGRYDEKGKKAPQTGGLIAYQEGGETLDGPHQALIGEKGKEYVIDNKSFETTEKVAPGLLDILNYNVNDKASLVKYLPNIIASLSKYTSYEDQSESIIILDDVPETQMNYAFSSPSVNISMESRGIDNKDFETLEML